MCSFSVFFPCFPFTFAMNIWTVCTKWNTVHVDFLYEKRWKKIVATTKKHLPKRRTSWKKVQVATAIIHEAIILTESKFIWISRSSRKRKLGELYIFHRAIAAWQTNFLQLGSWDPSFKNNTNDVIRLSRKYSLGSRHYDNNGNVLPKLNRKFLHSIQRNNIVNVCELSFFFR